VSCQVYSRILFIDFRVAACYVNWLELYSVVVIDVEGIKVAAPSNNNIRVFVSYVCPHSEIFVQIG